MEIQSEMFCPCVGWVSQELLRYRVSQELLRYRVSQELLRNTTLLISSSNYAKCHINVCSGGDLCSPLFSNFSGHPV